MLLFFGCYSDLVLLIRIGMVGGYGCHRGSKEGYHLWGPYAGRSFKSGRSCQLESQFKLASTKTDRFRRKA
jgi:hypothetical protein